MKLKRIWICLIILAVVFFTGVTVLKNIFPLKYEDVIDLYADRYNLQEELVAGVIYAESGFDTSAHSGKAMGLMQITEDTARWICNKLEMEFSEDMLYIPEVNIKMGSYYLRYLMDMYKNTETALAAYNAGMGNVTRWLADERYSNDGHILLQIPYGETERYVQRVNKFKQIYKILYR